jgi:rubrerythrin
MRNYTTNLKEYQVYQDLIDESHFHLKSFGNMLAIMGILSIPRVVTQNLYKVTDLTKFLNDGIAEEEAAKEECVRLAKAVNDEELEKFFSFINFQENYHIELMKRLL